MLLSSGFIQKFGILLPERTAHPKKAVLFLVHDAYIKLVSPREDFIAFISLPGEHYVRTYM
jgi:hypothetical protein